VAVSDGRRNSGEFANVKIWRADVTVPAADHGYCLRWFETESEALAWANDCAQDTTPDIREIEVPYDVAQFIVWMNDQAAV
jgi:hypothetical protein